MYSGKYEVALKEKMLLKLEKDRLVAKVENMDLSVKQILEDSKNDPKNAVQAKPAKPKDKTVLKMTGVPSIVPMKDRVNPFVSESYEPSGSHLSCQKTFRGHLMGVTSLSFNPKKDILATGSDDTTWKLWSVPNGDLIMSG